MDRYPNHSFAASSAQQYVWLEELYPDIFKRVQEKVKSGNWEPVGGSWLEHDCILVRLQAPLAVWATADAPSYQPSGESLCRQYLYGQRYFMEKFGVRSNLSWCPDTFGYAQVLPQIFRQAGIHSFFTQKVCVLEPSPLACTDRPFDLALLEQHQPLPAFDVQLGRTGW